VSPKRFVRPEASMARSWEVVMRAGSAGALAPRSHAAHMTVRVSSAAARTGGGG
jgi:hypothetical protein